jgi:HPt (histidine-containing phosphotransfer) domain-containing protein
LLPAAPDLSELRKMTLNDEGLFQSVISQFVEETTEDIRNLRAMMATNEAKNVRDIVHRLSGRLSQLSMGAFGSQLYSIESRIVAGKPVSELTTEIDNILAQLDDLITQLTLTNIERLN